MSLAERILTQLSKNPNFQRLAKNQNVQRITKDLKVISDQLKARSTEMNEKLKDDPRVKDALKRYHVLSQRIHVAQKDLDSEVQKALKLIKTLRLETLLSKSGRSAKKTTKKAAPRRASKKTTKKTSKKASKKTR